AAPGPRQRHQVRAGSRARRGPAGRGAGRGPRRSHRRAHDAQRAGRLRAHRPRRLPREHVRGQAGLPHDVQEERPQTTNARRAQPVLTAGGQSGIFHEAGPHPEGRMELKGARWLVSSVAALAAVAACTSKSNGPPPGATFDGSVASDASFQEDSGADSSALRDATQEQATQEAATTDSASDSALEAGDASIPDAGADGTTVLCSAGMTDPLTSVS